MGSPIESTGTGAEGAYYAGAGSGMDSIWVFVALGLCVLAIVMGAAHELSSYRKNRR